MELEATLDCDGGRQPAEDYRPAYSAAEVGIARPAVGSDEFSAPVGSTLP